MRRRLRSPAGPMALIVILLAACGGDPEWESATQELNAPASLQRGEEAPRLAPHPEPAPRADSAADLSAGPPIQLHQAAWQMDDDPVPINGQAAEELDEQATDANVQGAREADDDPVPINGQTVQEGDDDPVPINGRTARETDDDPVPINGQTKEEVDDDPVPINGTVDLARLGADPSSDEPELAPDLVDRITSRR